MLCRSLPIFLATMLLSASLAWGCPNCKETVAQNSPTTPAVQTAQPAQGYNASVLYMIGSMYAVLGGLGFMAFHYFRKYAPDINKT